MSALPGHQCVPDCVGYSHAQTDDDRVDGRVNRCGAGHRIDRSRGRDTGRETRRGAACHGALVVPSVLAGLRGRRFGNALRSKVPSPGTPRPGFRALVRVCTSRPPWPRCTARLYYVSPSPLPQSSLIYFGIAAIFTYVLAILSVKRLSARLNPTVWRTVRTLGVEYIALVFLTDFAKNSFQGGVWEAAYYLPFLALAIAGPLLRLAALVKRLSQVRRLAV